MLAKLPPTQPSWTRHLPGPLSGSQAKLQSPDINCRVGVSLACLALICPYSSPAPGSHEHAHIQ